LLFPLVVVMVCAGLASNQNMEISSGVRYPQIDKK
jgi:hypothetical protein